MLKRDLIQWKGKCNAQPSQDNHEDMVKKLEKGSTDACIKPYQKGYKSNNGKVKGILKEVQSVQNAVVQPAAQTAVVPHLDRTGKFPRPSRCNVNQRRLSSLASSARKTVTMSEIAP